MMKMNRSFLSKVCLFALFVIFVSAQSFAQKVTGVVVDETNSPLPGVNVVVKGTTNGVITDMDGKYSIAPKDVQKDILQFSFIGYDTKEVKINGEKLIDIQLTSSNLQLEEVVAVGYGVVKKRDLTGSVASVKSDEISKATTSNAMQAMQARVPGLDIQQSNGQAGAGININLRGNRSISASNSPLILVDGIEYGSTLDINPSDIESMEVLKDASSTAIYGTRGANGVIIITTKRGKSGTTKVNFNAYYSSNSPTNVPKVMYGDREVQRLIDKANYQADATSGNWGTSNLTPEQVLTEKLEDFTEIGIYNDKSYTNWLDQILQNGVTKNYELSVSGGTDKTTFNLSLGSMFEEGLMKDDKMNRYNVKANVDHKISNIFKAGTSLLFTYKDNDKRNSSVFGQAMKMTTITHAYTADGTLIATPNPRYAAHCNPLLDEIDGAYKNNGESSRFFGNAYLEITPIKGMNAKSIFAVDRNNIRTGIYQDYQSVARYQSPGTSNISLEYENKTGLTWENTLNYSTNFGGTKHDFTGLLGHSMKQSVYEEALTTGDVGREHYYTSLFYDLSKIPSPKNTSQYVKSTMMSYFGRVNYKYNEKYLLTASLRADGSSTLAKGHQWGYFPSAALAWRVSEESFLKGYHWLNNMKLRTSWGISGNAAVNPYSTLTTLSTTPVYYYIGGSDLAGNLPSSMGNSDLTWEKTAAYNVGLDFGVFDNRISGTVDYFISQTSDLLYRKSAPASSVYPSVLANIGETKGHGIEVSLNTLVLKKKDFSWDINWTYTTFKDEITKLSDGVTTNISGNTGQIVGKPVSIYYDFEANGNWNVGEYATYKADWESRHPGQTIGYVAAYGAPGTIKIVDRDDDGKLTDADKIVYNRSPKHIFGMNNSMSYKNFSLSVLVYARLGGYISYDMNSQLNYESANWGDLDYWTPKNIAAKFPSPGAASTTFGSYGSALLYEKADYLKIKDITLGYTLPKGTIKKVGLNNVKVYGSLKNYFTFSKIDNYDPERGGAISFPLSKQAVVGVNVEF
ncbi:MAG TPA: TonB-dependent receptor [Prolixibacteraceae bacterium]|nr:TonB-dependent receptor [Prolixibacteraceae bacterium]